jgi:glutamine synthetase
MLIENRIGDRQPAGPGQTTAVRDVLKVQDVHVIDLKFTDLPGAWQHLGLSAHALDEAAFAAGIGLMARRSAASRG